MFWTSLPANKGATTLNKSSARRFGIAGLWVLGLSLLVKGITSGVLWETVVTVAVASGKALYALGLLQLEYNVVTLALIAVFVLMLADIVRVLNYACAIRLHPLDAPDEVARLERAANKWSIKGYLWALFALVTLQAFSLLIYMIEPVPVFVGVPTKEFNDAVARFQTIELNTAIGALTGIAVVIASYWPSYVPFLSDTTKENVRWYPGAYPSFWEISSEGRKALASAHAFCVKARSEREAAQEKERQDVAGEQRALSLIERYP